LPDQFRPGSKPRVSTYTAVQICGATSNLPGIIQVTVSLKAVSCGTDLNIVQEGIPEVIPVEMCYLGWQESLAALAKLVEPEIPG
jgi:hypothetical protein